jgi:hypothetical protein
MATTQSKRGWGPAQSEAERRGWGTPADSLRRGEGLATDPHNKQIDKFIVKRRGKK